jgi:purine-binding chemotaxis protein CheW
LDSTTPTLEPTATPTLLFRVGSTVYGCDIGDAQEILPLRAATRLPGAPPYVRGLINVRGTIVTLLDVAARLGGAPVESGSILLIRYRERLVGLAVEEVVDVRELEIDTTAASASGGMITRGVATADGATVVVLDVEALIRQVLLS